MRSLYLKWSSLHSSWPVWSHGSDSENFSFVCAPHPGFGKTTPPSLNLHSWEQKNGISRQQSVTAQSQTSGSHVRSFHGLCCILHAAWHAYFMTLIPTGEGGGGLTWTPVKFRDSERWLLLSSEHRGSHVLFYLCSIFEASSQQKPFCIFVSGFLIGTNKRVMLTAENKRAIMFLFVPVYMFICLYC